MRRLTPVLALSFACAAPSREQSPDESAVTTTSAEPQEASELVKLSAALIETNEGAMLAVVYDIAPGWHIYWENPGDSGLPTKAKITGEGSEALGPFLHPAPHRYVSEGPIVTFGHEKRTALFAGMPANLRSSEAEFALEGSWLACREGCVKGSATTKGRWSALEVDPSLSAVAERLPRPLAEAGAVRWEGETLVAEFGAGVVEDAFPLQTHPAKLLGQTLAGPVARLEFSGTKDATTDGIRVVFAVQRDANHSYYEVKLPWP